MYDCFRFDVIIRNASWDASLKFFENSKSMWLSDWCKISQKACRENEWENISGIKGDENDETLVSLRFYLTQLFLCCSPTENPPDLFCGKPEAALHWERSVVFELELSAWAPNPAHCFLDLARTLFSLCLTERELQLFTEYWSNYGVTWYFVSTSSGAKQNGVHRGRENKGFGISAMARQLMGNLHRGSTWDAFQWEIMIICKANAFNVWHISDRVRFKNGSP